MSAAWRRWPSSDVSFSVEWTWAIDREARRESEGAARIATERPFPRGCVGGRQQSTCLAPPLPASSYAARFTAGAAGFLNLSQSFVRPATPSCFDTIPS